MSKLSMASMLAMLSSLFQTNSTKQLVFNHKERVKSGITHHKPKPGRGHPAKGYDPITKTWHKAGDS